MNKKMVVGGIILSLIPIYFGLRSCQKKTDSANSDTVLAPEESAAVVVDPSQHRITLITKDYTKAFTLPARPSRVSLLTGDGIKITSPQYGTEFNPSLGVAYTLQGGVILAGLDLFYWKRLDIGMGLAVNPVKVQDTGVYVGFSYLAYSNTSVGLGLDNHTNPMLFVKVRI